MKEYWGTRKTNVETIRQYGELADRGGDAGAAARSWTEEGFDDETTAQWLEARCFDPRSARALADLSVSPKQASKRTRDGGGGDYVDTIAYKVSNGDLSARQGAARAGSSR
jgi:hypothetical protein